MKFVCARSPFRTVLRKIACARRPSYEESRGPRTSLRVRRAWPSCTPPPIKQWGFIGGPDVIVRQEFGFQDLLRFYFPFLPLARDGLDALHRWYIPLVKICPASACLYRFVVIVHRFPPEPKQDSPTLKFVSTWSSRQILCWLSRIGDWSTRLVSNWQTWK